MSNLQLRSKANNEKTVSFYRDKKQYLKTIPINFQIVTKIVRNTHFMNYGYFMLQKLKPQSET